MQCFAAPLWAGGARACWCSVGVLITVHIWKQDNVYRSDSFIHCALARWLTCCSFPACISAAAVCSCFARLLLLHAWLSSTDFVRICWFDPACLGISFSVSLLGEPTTFCPRLKVFAFVFIPPVAVRCFLPSTWRVFRDYCCAVVHKLPIKLWRWLTVHNCCVASVSYHTHVSKCPCIYVHGVVLDFEIAKQHFQAPMILRWLPIQFNESCS